MEIMPLQKEKPVLFKDTLERLSAGTFEDISYLDMRTMHVVRQNCGREMGSGGKHD